VLELLMPLLHLVRPDREVVVLLVGLAQLQDQQIRVVVEAVQAFRLLADLEVQVL
jgi:hypothetical protein